MRHKNRSRFHGKSKQFYFTGPDNSQIQLRTTSETNASILDQFRSGDKNQMRFKDDVPPPNVVLEGWMRLSLKTPGIEGHFPPVQSDDPKGEDHKLKYVNRKEEAQAKALEKKTYFDHNRLNTQFGKDPLVLTPDSFYFRYTGGHHLYYTESATDTVILQGVEVVQIENRPDKKDDCFLIHGVGGEFWVLCSEDGTCPENWKSLISIDTKDDFGGCPQPPAEEVPDAPKDKTMEEKTDIQIQPYFIQPQPAEDCKYDFNYKYHGVNWKCNCQEGLKQSPINLPVREALYQAKNPVHFAYNYLEAKSLQVVYDRNIIRIRAVQGKNFGTATLPGPQNGRFVAYEIEIHTPAEHFKSGRTYDMEITVKHKCIDGDFRYQLNLAFLYRKEPGATKPVFQKIDLMNLPNPSSNEGSDIITDKLHPLNFMFDEESDIVSNTPFNYFIYEGSNTSPPCEEFVYWIIPEETFKISSTVISMFMDSLLDPKSEVPNPVNTGNNRVVMKLGKRFIEFYDLSANFIVKPKVQKYDAPDLKSHYERIEVQEPFYFYVKKNEPSDLEGALVVGNDEIIKMGIDPKYPDGKRLDVETEEEKNAKREERIAQELKTEQGNAM